jgi:penicillin-binding protein 1A
MPWLRRILTWGLILFVLGIVAGIGALATAYWLVKPRLPDVATIREIRLQVPLRVLSADGKLIAVFGESRRTPVAIDRIPEHVRQAFIAIEDARFYEHRGIDPVGIARAVWLLLTTEDQRVPGGSTITQQVAKNFFLSPEYSFTRKLTEIFLALKLERELTKDEIFALYLNKIFFGHRAYGIVAAADFYYGKPLEELTLAEAAMLASIPKFPSTANPIANPARARLRRDYVLQRMLEEGFIDRATFEAAVAEEDTARAHEPAIEVEAPWLAEMVRVAAIERLGADALTGGYSVHTTIDSRHQEAANRALRAGLIEYDRRHGWHGAEGRVELPAEAAAADWRRALGDRRPVVGLEPAIVLEAAPGEARLGLADGQEISLPVARMAWARRFINENARGPTPTRTSDVLARGDIVRVFRDRDGEWQLGQIPRAQGAVVAIDPRDGAVKALVGGFSFGLSKFNRAIQSQRNPGSSFKPFVYSAAFERGFHPASVINDAPIELIDPSRPDGVWRPSNDDNTFMGPMRLRDAMVRSRNLVSVRLLDATGMAFARNHMARFGFPLQSLPGNLSLALGTSSVTPLSMARAYAVFANGGYLVDPWFMARIDDDRGQPIYEAAAKRAAGGDETVASDAEVAGLSVEDLGALLGTLPPPAAPAGTERPVEGAAADSRTDPAGGEAAPRVLDARNAFLVTSLLRDVVLRGTGRGAMALGRNDLGGKTGTTNDHRDAWFAGYNASLVAVSWVGLDDFSSLGRGEFASRTALPIWTEFMRVALDGVPELPLETPPGLIQVALGGGPADWVRVEDLARIEAEAAAAESEAADQQLIDIF